MQKFVLTFAHYLPPSSIARIKSQTETFCCRLTRADLQEGTWPLSDHDRISIEIVIVVVSIASYQRRSASVARWLRYLVGRRTDRGSNPGSVICLEQVSWLDTAQCSLFVLKVPLNTNQQTKPINIPAVTSGAPAAAAARVFCNSLIEQKTF